jgi:O-succinylhomoserine sulfhydrylase
VTAELLQNSPAVKSVSYPLLASHPDFEVASRQMSAGGGVVSFLLKGGATAARRLLDSASFLDMFNHFQLARRVAIRTRAMSPQYRIYSP